jgi:hypothetical protein
MKIKISSAWKDTPTAMEITPTDAKNPLHPNTLPNAKMLKSRLAWMDGQTVTKNTAMDVKPISMMTVKTVVPATKHVMNIRLAILARAASRVVTQNLHVKTNVFKRHCTLQAAQMILSRANQAGETVMEKFQTVVKSISQIII